MYVKHCKRIKLPNVYLISGGVKTGKSMVSVAFSVKTYKKNLRLAKFRNAIIKFINIFLPKRLKFDLPLLPMLYSNIKLRNIKYNLLTLDIILRKVRIPNKSVVLIDECSLLADSMLFKDKKINNQLMLFIKLFGHYTHGGTLIVNTQSIGDLHFSFKRCISNYLWIYSKTKLPFFTKFNVRELMYSDDNASITNTITTDTEKDMLPFFFLNKYYKYYDCYCYSILTDNLVYQVNYDEKVLSKKDSLKTKTIISLQDFDLKGV